VTGAATGASPRAAPAPAVSAASDEAAYNPPTHEFEFFGPHLGPAGIILGLPALTWAFAYFCGPAGWPSVPGGGADWAAALAPRALAAAVASTWSLEVFALYCVWWLALALLALVLPGPTVAGAPLRDGRTLPYKLNGLASLAVVAAAAAGVQAVKPGGVGLAWLYEHTAQVVTASIVFSFGLSAYVYAASFARDGPGPAGARQLAEGGNSGLPLYDFFIGRELNPRAFSGALDLKFFCELRPGLFLWLLLNASAAVAQFEATGRVDAAMAIVCAFQGYYVVDSVLNERSILTTMDITTDGFGFMLAFGDLAWVPGTYALQARYLAPRPLGAHPAASAAVVAVALAGMYVFRAANSEKDEFKRDPSSPAFARVRSVLTPTGTRLLAEGSWWGRARHINYLADWVMALAWSLATGFGTPLTYFYPAYFAVLLVHRDLRDGEKCHKKYGKAWEEYCRRVPYHIVPGVY